MQESLEALGRIRLSGRGSRAEQVYRSVRGAILDDTLSPGTPLPEKDLAAVTAVSRTPVREALHRLEVDGLVESNGRGMMVADVSAEELADLCVVRETMEGLAARLAARVRSDLDIAVLDGLLSLTREAAEAGDVNRLIELNHAFHETIWRVARNRFLTRQLLLLRDLIERRQDSTLYDASRQREMVDEHTAIAAAIAEQNPDAAQRVALAHLHRATALRLINQRSRQRGSDSR